MQKRPILIAFAFGLLMTGCSDQRSNPVPPISAVPLGSFVAFDAEPQFREVRPGTTIPANKWPIVVPRFLNKTRPGTSLSDVDWFVLPYEADSLESCEKKALILIEDFDGDGNVARCIRSDGTPSFAADADLL